VSTSNQLEKNYQICRYFVHFLTFFLSEKEAAEYEAKLKE